MSLDKKKMRTDDESTQIYRGIIVDNKDPEYTGYCKIRVYGKYDMLDDEDLPWAKPKTNSTFGGNNGSGFISIPKIDTEVEVIFNNGDIYKPEYKSIIHINKDLIETIKESYENAHSILYDSDQDLKMYYTEKDGFLIYLDGSYINIKTDNSIVIEHKETQSILELKGGNITMTSNTKIELTSGTKIETNSKEVHINGNTTKLGTTANYSSVMAEPLWAFLKQLSTAVDAKWPQTPGVLTGAANLAEQASTSKTVKTTL